MKRGDLMKVAYFLKNGNSDIVENVLTISVTNDIICITIKDKMSEALVFIQIKLENLSNFYCYE